MSVRLRSVCYVVSEYKVYCYIKEIKTLMRLDLRSVLVLDV